METLTIVIVCLAAGGGLGWLAARARTATQLARLRATVDAAQAGEARLEQAMRTLTFEATVQSQEAVARAVAPLHDTLRRYEQQVAQLERDRQEAYGQLREQLRTVGETSAGVRAETGRLVAALRTTHVRGRWGEQQLRRIVEAAGMSPHCDFDEQVRAVRQTGDTAAAIRPDLVVRLHGGRTVVVDAKAPLDSYLTATEAADDRSRDQALDGHARALRSHIELLSSKAYWQAFSQNPEFVVLFLPGDPFLDAALRREPTLLEHAFARNVVLATPSTLIALLRTVAYTWRSEALSRSADQVLRLARELYGRLSTMGGHVNRLGASLGSAVAAYNAAVGSLEGRVLVTARKMAELGVSDGQLAEPAQVEVQPRQAQAAELLDSADAAGQPPPR